VRASAPSGAGRTLVTLEGVPLNDPFGGWTIWGAIPPERIAHATVMRGAGAGPYGAGALLGTVRLDERQDAGVLVSLSVGDLGFSRASALAAAEDRAFSLTLGATFEQSNGWIPVRTGRGDADTALDSEAASGVARLLWSDGARVFSARLSAYSEERSAGLVGADSANSGSMLSFVFAQPEGPLNWRLQAWAIRSDLANTSVTVAPDRNTTTPANNQYATPALGWGGNAALRWSHNAGGAEIGVDVRGADGETRELFRYQAGAFTRSRIAGGQTLLGGAYVELWRGSRPWLISGGARLDYWRAFGGARVERDLATDSLTLASSPADNDAWAPTARFGVRRALGGPVSLRAAAYAGFRPPTLNELHRPFRVGNDVTEANAGLSPEKLGGADIAVEFESDSFAWSIGGFATRLEDAIVNVTLGAGPGTFPPGVFVPAGGAFRQRQNAGEIDAYGLEADARGDLGALSWRVALNAVRARLGDLRPAQSPSLSAAANFTWRLTSVTAFGADITHESRRFEDDLNTRTLSPSTRVDLRLDHAVSDRATVFAALDNAFDAAVETAETADGVESFGAPRALRLGLRLR